MNKAGPLSGTKIVEFTHAVMGPSCGLILGDLGADVVFVEPPGGSPTRKLKGFGSGYFTYFGRNKRSICLDLKSEKGLEIATDLIGKADVLIENFAPGTMDRLGLGESELSERFEKLIYCSMKGFLSGPYEKRAAMDEVVQMMGGLAYMTGPTGRPLRAGTSVIDITGGMFGVIGILAALKERDVSGRGASVKSSLFETTAFLMGQHMAWSSISKSPIPPMPERVSAWSIYQIFETMDHPTFVGIISEKHWRALCEAFEQHDWLKRDEFKTNNDRIKSREILLPLVKNLFLGFTQKQIMERLEKASVPCANIARPEDLFEDPHLNEGGALCEVVLENGEMAKLPRLPLEYSGNRSHVRHQPPKVGEHTNEILCEWLEMTEEGVNKLIDDQIVQ